MRLIAIAALVAASCVVRHAMRAPDPRFVIEDEAGRPALALGLHPPDEKNPARFFVRCIDTTAPLEAELRSFYADGKLLQPIPLHLAPGSRAGPFVAILARRLLVSSADDDGITDAVSDRPDILAPVVLDGIPGHLMMLPGTAVRIVEVTRRPE